MMFRWPEEKNLPTDETRWLEAILLTGFAVGAGFLFHRQDPFFLAASFPWIWFAPVLIALRYGLAPALFSVTLLALLLLVMIRFGLLAGPFPVKHMLGGLVLTMICGQFSSVWCQRLRRAGLLSQHAAERAEQLSREYFMMRLSHDRLEQNLISRPMTLRDGIARLRLLLAEQGGEVNPEVGAGLMAILSHYCRLESASLYLMAKGELSGDPVYSCGRGAPLERSDPLLCSALDSEDALCQSVGNLKAGRQSRYLVAAPMRHSSGELVGMLLVADMPFMALNNEFLQILGLLLSYCADHALAAKTAGDILEHYPDCPAVFASELNILHRLSSTLGITSTLVLLHLPASPRAEDLSELLALQVRGIDQFWKRSLADGIQLVTLMPFSGEEGVDGYRRRVSESLQQRFGTSWEEAGIASRFRSLLPALSTPALLGELFEGTDA
jgi:polysaccharide biosynthesis protein PelD